MNLERKSYEELIESRKQSVPGGDVYEQLSKEIERIQQDTSNKQTADLVNQIKTLNTSIALYSNSNNRASNAMIVLTCGLTILALAQFLVAYFSYKSDQRYIQVRRNCYHSTLQTSDIDLNYKNCLRDHGFSE